VVFGIPIFGRGRGTIASLPDVMPIEGGVPLGASDLLEGAIGFSGGTSQQDGAVANAGAELLNR
jgi:glc operon protein GlcG